MTDFVGREEMKVAMKIVSDWLDTIPYRVRRNLDSVEKVALCREITSALIEAKENRPIRQVPGEKK